MERPTYENDSEQPTLLILNDNCLMKIFQFFDIGDFLNVYNTCQRLRNICTSVCALKYKEIQVECNGSDDASGRAMSKRFVDILSMIGTHVLSVNIRDPIPYVIDTIREKCKNITNLRLTGSEHPLQVQGFRNLKELRLNTLPRKMTMSIEDLKNCFANNPDLETLDCECWYTDCLMETLTMLPKLKTLVLPCFDFFNISDHSEHLLRLDGLTKLLFDSNENCNQLLMKLSKNLNLKELTFSAFIDTDTFRIMESFRNVEVLQIFHTDDSEDCDISDAVVFPPKLDYIRTSQIRISCKTFLSIVKPLKFLKKFVISYGDIYSDRNKSVGIRSPKTICRIANGLRGEIIQPELKVIFSSWGSVEQTDIIYNSDRLKIIKKAALFPISSSRLPSRKSGIICVQDVMRIFN